MAIFPVVLWLTARYFDRPTILRGIGLGAGMAALFYIHGTSVLAYAMLGLYTLLVYRQAIWRWWLPGLAST